MSDTTDFLNILFPAEILQKDEIIVCAPNKYEARTRDDYLAGLKSRSRAEAYYCTSTFYRQDDGELRRRGANFAGLFAVVFDDIGEGPGSKCSRDKFPVELWGNATNRVETSPLNFQVGFALAEPIRDLEHAKELIRILYSAGAWDGGGAMPNKLLRLPSGYNTKKNRDKSYVYDTGDGKPWAVRLDHLDDVVWTPQELLDSVNAGVGWEDIQRGVGSKRNPRRTRGAAPYIEGVAMDERGIIDPLVEWLNERGMIVHEDYPWVAVECINAEAHTDDKRTAGYSPLGWGESEHWRSFRSYRCFHDHCSKIGGREFILAMQALGAPDNLPVKDEMGGMVGRYALDTQSSEWVDLPSASLNRTKDGGFSLGHRDKVFIPRDEGVTAVARYKLLIENRDLLKLNGTCYHPGGELIEERDYGRALNECQVPFYGEGGYDQAHVDTFREFVQYLLPSGGDAEFLIRHLARKAQVPDHRGPGIFMFTRGVEGTGRGTLAAIIGKLWGGLLNVGQPGMESFSRGLTGGFNTELRKLWLIVPEAQEVDATARKRQERYEHFKRFCDPAPVLMTWNVKNVREWQEYCYASVIVCSNHPDGLIGGAQTRRIKRMENTAVPWSSEQFTAIHAWIASNVWMESLWRYFLGYDLDGWTGSENLYQGATEEERDANLVVQSPIFRGLELAREFVTAEAGGVCTVDDIVSAVMDCAIELGLHENTTAAEHVARQAAGGMLLTTRKAVKVAGATVRFRFAANAVGQETRRAFEAHELPGTDLVALYQAGTGKAALTDYIQRRLRDLE